MAPRRHSTVNVDLTQHAEARAAIRLVARVTGRPYTMAQFVREAFQKQLAVIRREYNNDNPIPPDAARLPAGNDSSRRTADNDNALSRNDVTDSGDRNGNHHRG